jgi:hypothetical protein
MGNLIESLIDLVATIWRTDTEMRDNSVFGESEMERKDRKAVAWVCGGTIALLVLGGVVLLWWIQRQT